MGRKFSSGELDELARPLLADVKAALTSATPPEGTQERAELALKLLVPH